ncbi:MAG: hypothetical protein U5K84_06315 [Alkalibacterium sp.]|nr:hypothetical protein [Alkalibacterium sp.]
MMGKILQEADDLKEAAAGGEQSAVDQVDFEDEEMAYHSRLNDSGFEIYRDGSWEDFKIQRREHGNSEAGHLAGETASTFNEYARWFDQISLKWVRMSSGSIRYAPRNFITPCASTTSRHSRRCT